LASGLTAAFAVAGTFLTLLLVSTGTDPEFFRYIAAVLLVATGILLIVQRLGDRAAMALSRLTAGIGAGGPSSATGGVAQFGVGALLGVVWLPGVGPTVGVAIALASFGENLLGSFSVMLAYGLGTGGVLLAVGLLSGRILAEKKALGARVGAVGKKVLGWSVLLLGILVLTGMDKILEAWAIDLLPSWVYSL
jgi:cytochrome c biogenesis protein CcdA